MMASAQVVETSVNTNNSPSQDYTTDPDDHSNHNTDSPGFKPFTVIDFTLKEIRYHYLYSLLTFALLFFVLKTSSTFSSTNTYLLFQESSRPSRLLNLPEGVDVCVWGGKGGDGGGGRGYILHGCSSSVKNPGIFFLSYLKNSVLFLVIKWAKS